MSTDIDDLFDAAIDPLTRDQWGRPLLVPGPERAANPFLTCRKERPDGKIPYTRASSLANYVSDQSGLATWQQRSLTKGLSEREDLAAMGAALPPIHGNLKPKSLLTKAELSEDAATNRELDGIAEQAMVHANRDYKAHWGTAIHSFTDLPEGEGAVPQRMVDDVQSWHDATRGWVFHLTEAFVRNDELQSAGTFDHLIEIPWRPDLGAMVVDKKTGLLHWDQFPIQLDVYAGGELYDPETDEVRPWPVEPSRTHAIVAHIPYGEGRTVMYLVDLVAGHAAALTAIAVRDHRQRAKGYAVPVDFAGDRAKEVATLVGLAESRETMTAIAAFHKDVWSTELRDLARARLAEIEAD